MDTYENKFNEAFSRAKKLHETCDSQAIIGWCEYIFPELKENDDEMIKQKIIKLIKMSNAVGGYALHQWEADEMLAWIEKQGQKKTDEHKFNVGDWITDGELTCKVLGITSKSYELHLYNDDYWHFETDIQSVDKRYHLWTIQDAKPGDVLAVDSRPFIYNGSKNEVTVGAYCGFNTKHSFSFAYNYTINQNITPATKEQRDLLFVKMKENGYEWDDEKKELNKIEDEEYNGEDYGIDSLYHAQRILEKTLGKVDGYQTDDGILSHQCAITAIKKLYKQKSAEWSEEDEEMLKWLCGIVHSQRSGKVITLKEESELGKWIDKWLNHNPQSQWKPSDEQIEALGMAIDIGSIPEKYYTELNKLYYELKKLKE